MPNIFADKTILITGGTGSFGNAFVPLTLASHPPKRMIIYSRDEMKQWDMKLNYENDPQIEFVVGDVRDSERLARVAKGVDHIVHAAATKIVPTAEYNPSECIKTNINGAMNVIEAAIDAGVQSVVALSTDKACNPVNLYGASKLASDKLFVASNASYQHGTKFSVVRYGNVMGSRGSVIPFFRSCAKSGKIPITDPRMTRFMISLEDAVEIVWHAFQTMQGGEIYVKKLPTMNIMDIAEAVAPHCTQEIVGIRPGEKLHEQMINEEDAPHTYEYADYYKILPAIHAWSEDPKRIQNGKKVSDGFTYSSDNNLDVMTVEELRGWINSNKTMLSEH